LTPTSQNVPGRKKRIPKNSCTEKGALRWELHFALLKFCPPQFFARMEIKEQKKMLIFRCSPPPPGKRTPVSELYFPSLRPPRGTYPNENVILQLCKKRPFSSKVEFLPPPFRTKPCPFSYPLPPLTPRLESVQSPLLALLLLRNYSRRRRSDSSFRPVSKERKKKSTVP